MCIEPVFPDTYFHFHWHFKLNGLAHQFGNILFHKFYFVPVNIEYQLIVDLHGHPCLQFLFHQPVMNIHHGNLDDVCCSTLDGSVDCISFREAAGACISVEATSPAIARGIRRFAAMDTAALCSMAQRARQTVESAFTWRAATVALLDAYAKFSSMARRRR